MELTKLYDRETVEHFQRIADSIGVTANQVADVVEHLARPVHFCSNHFSEAPHLESCYKALRGESGVCRIASEALASLLAASH